MSSLNALWGFFVAAGLSVALTPVAGRLAHRVGAVATVGGRSLHERDTPSLGGLAIFVGVVAGTLVWLPVTDELGAILAGAALITAVGAYDDARDLHPGIKLVGQILAASIPVLAGVTVQNITLPFVGALELGQVGDLLTIVGIVAVMNVVNFTDGVDGLAAGVCTISAATFAAIALSLDRVEAGVLSAVVAGAALGFLWHNFHPASVFMGDAGSNLLGFLLACVAVQGVLKTAAVVALVFPLVILAVPILDTGFVVAKRIKYGAPVYRPDRWHFHHRLVNIGFSQRQTVLYLYGWTLTLALFALSLRFIPYSDDHGNFNTGWTVAVVAAGVAAIAASFYLVVVLEILKLRSFRWVQAVRDRAGRGATPTREQVDAEVAEQIATGEFPAVER